jgi:hypothetical protein
LIASPAALYDRYVKNIKIRNSSCWLSYPFDYLLKMRLLNVKYPLWLIQVVWFDSSVRGCGWWNTFSVFQTGLVVSVRRESSFKVSQGHTSLLSPQTQTLWR